LLPSGGGMDPERPPTAEALNEGPATIPRTAASLILLRDAEPGFELLLVKRSPAQRFMGGYWVFPGGAVDADEGEGEAAWRAAAVRELHEEAAIGGIEPGALVRYSRWITPELLRIRFDTHFFLARAPAGATARADGVECVAERWGSPSDLLADYGRGALTLAFPTLRHIEQLSAFASVAEILERARTHDLEPVLPRVVRSGKIARLVLPGEPGYDAAARPARGL
jgi:8-oxo-dGTP pyrophosphatase MutT (NUDIX family)